MEANREYWRAVSVFTNYEVSSVGRVRNSKTGRVLKPSDNGSGYMQVVLAKNGSTKTFKVHRLVAETFIENPLGKRCVDHIDGNRRNNTIENLRWASDSENQMNAIKKQSNASSTHKGVSLHKASNKWVAYVQIGNARKHLGCFTDEREAAEAYNAAAIEHYGVFAKLNDLTTV